MTFAKMSFFERVKKYLKFNHVLGKRAKKNQIKKDPENFIVEEITLDNTVLEIDKRINKPDIDGKFVHFVLQKKNWETTHALHTIAKKIRRSKKIFSFAGTKDKNTISTQLISMYNGIKDEILNLKIKDIQINGAWQHHKKISLGDLLGNRFTITLTNKIDKQQVELFKQANIFPNYFGEQRFGYRKNNHIVGKLIIQNRLHDAMVEFLTGSPIDEIEDARVARETLRNDMNYKNALKNFPKHLRHERTVIQYLTKYERDFANAFRQLPRELLLMFVHSYQAYLFNKLLQMRICNSTEDFYLEEGEYLCDPNNGYPIIEKKQDKGLPVAKLIGYNTKLNESEKLLLEDEGISINDFKIKHMQELALKGGFRHMFAEPIELNINYTQKKMKFCLAKGCYATVFLNTLFKLEN